MNITSIQFVIFLFILIFVFYMVRGDLQWMVLLCGSIFFYIHNGILSLFVISLTIISTWICGLYLERENINTKLKIKDISIAERKKIKKQSKARKRRVLSVFIVFNLGVLLYLKYFNFFIDTMNLFFSTPFEHKNLWQPLGISFYTFQSIGYLFDLYRDKCNAQKNMAKYALFVLFFPQIIQGPFNRYKELSKTLFAQHIPEYIQIKYGLQRMLWGYIKKRVIADRLGLLVSCIFTDYQMYSGFQIWVGAIAYTIQIYADFSGYMDIMCGICQVLGIHMLENFNHPYFSKSVAEFWRRWHISLGAWFREYMFYPISMSKLATKTGNRLRKHVGARFGSLFSSYIALVAVWFCTGLWHGANWTYVVWALINVFFILTSMQFEEVYAVLKQAIRINESAWGWKIFQIIRTFFLVCLMRIFSRAETISDALGMYRKLICDFHYMEMLNFDTYKIGLQTMDIVIIIFSVCLLFSVSVYQCNKSVRSTISSYNIFIRWSIYLGAVFFLILFSVDSNGGFLYAVF